MVLIRDLTKKHRSHNRDIVECGKSMEVLWFDRDIRRMLMGYINGESMKINEIMRY